MKKIIFSHLIGLVFLACYFGIVSNGHARSKRSESTTSQTWLSLLVVAMKTYRLDYGKYPEGSSYKIAQALLGKNPKEILYLDWYRTHLSQNGMLLDPWGTRYNIVVYNQDHIKVTSAGENKLFGDKDDQYIEIDGKDTKKKF